MSFATSLPLLTNLALLLGLSLFFGLAFEEFQAQQGRIQPGGVRTFPLLALAGAMLYLLDATHLIPVSVGVLVLGAWLYAYYRSAVAERDAEGVPNVRRSSRTAVRATRSQADRPARAMALRGAAPASKADGK